MADDLEQKLNAANDTLPSQETGDLEDKVADPGFSFGRAFKDTLKFTPHLAVNAAISGLIFGAPSAILLTPFGLSVGRYFANRKKKKKTTYKEIEATSKVGVYGATLGIAAYSIPDSIVPGYSFLSTLAKVAIFDGLFVPAWLAWYKPTLHIAEKYGTKLKNFIVDAPKNLGEIYQNSLKGKWLRHSAETVATLSPIHLASFYFLKNPLYRLAVGTGNDVLLSMISGDEGILKTIKRKFGKKEAANDNQPPPDNIAQFPQQYQSPQQQRQAA